MNFTFIIFFEFVFYVMIQRTSWFVQLFFIFLVSFIIFKFIETWYFLFFTFFSFNKVILILYLKSGIQYIYQV
jgi:hypothetical protein